MLDQIKQSTRQACGRTWSTLKNRREPAIGSNLNLCHYNLSILNVHFWVEEWLFFITPFCQTFYFVIILSTTLLEWISFERTKKFSLNFVFFSFVQSVLQCCLHTPVSSMFALSEAVVSLYRYPAIIEWSLSSRPHW